MIKRIFLCLLFLLACNPYETPPAEAFSTAIQAVVGTTTASAVTCSLGDDYASGVQNLEISDLDIRYYVGQGAWKNASARCICKVVLKLTKAAGDISGKTYNVRIWDMDGTALNKQLGASANVTGSNSWNETSVEFSFASCVSLSASTNYAITVNHAGLLIPRTTPL